MICDKCKNRLEREQDGGLKVFCTLAGDLLGQAQRVNDPIFPLRYNARINKCSGYDQKKVLFADHGEPVPEPPPLPVPEIEPEKKGFFHPFLGWLK